MIDEVKAKRYCCEDISKIANYDKAIADKTQTWICHHRTAIWWNCSKKELKENDCYYHRKACELEFVTKSEHNQIHHSGKHHTKETKRRMSGSMKGKNKGKTLGPMSEEHRRKIGEAMKGKSWKLIDGKRVYFTKEVK